MIFFVLIYMLLLYTYPLPRQKLGRTLSIIVEIQEEAPLNTNPEIIGTLDDIRVIPFHILLLINGQ
jgi:hypothetical protein